MAKNCIGLDLGSSAVKVTQVKKKGSGFQLLNFGIEPIPPDTIVDGAILNHSGVVDAVRALFERLKIKQKEVALAISGNALIIKKIFVPAMTPDELEEQVPWEAEHHIPFNRNDVEIDYQALGGKNAQGQMELLLVAAKKEVVADYAAVAREAQLTPVVVDVAAFAVQNGFEAAYGPMTNEVVALINVGASLSNINILAGGTSAFTRDVTTGGNSFTDDIKRHLAVSGEEAEALKVAYTEGDASQDVGRVLQMTSAQMAGEFQKSIDFFLASHPDTAISKIYLAGGSARVPPLLSAIEQRARVPVEIMDPFRDASAPHIDPAFLRNHGPQAVVSLGLALRSSGDKFQ